MVIDLQVRQRAEEADMCELFQREIPFGAPVFFLTMRYVFFMGGAFGNHHGCKDRISLIT